MFYKKSIIYNNIQIYSVILFTLHIEVRNLCFRSLVACFYLWIFSTIQIESLLVLVKFLKKESITDAVSFLYTLTYVAYVKNIIYFKTVFKKEAIFQI